MQGSDEKDNGSGNEQQKLKPFKCLFPGCEKYFTKRSNLTQHTHIHTGERPFQCELCGSSFRQRGNLTKHLRSHKVEHLRWRRDTADKPFKCPYGCGKSFTAKSSLQVHIRTHTGELPFQCTYPDCNERFRHKAALASHIRQHEAMQQKRYHCIHPNCKMCFQTVNDLREHIHQFSPGLVAENCFLRQAVTKLLRVIDDLGVKHSEVRRAIEHDPSVKEVRTAMENLPAVQTAASRPPSQADLPLDSYLNVLLSYIGELDDDDPFPAQFPLEGEAQQQQQQQQLQLQAGSTSAATPLDTNMMLANPMLPPPPSSTAAAAAASPPLYSNQPTPISPQAPTHHRSKRTSREVMMSDSASPGGQAEGIACSGSEQRERRQRARAERR